MAVRMATGRGEGSSNTFHSTDDGMGSIWCFWPRIVKVFALSVIMVVSIVLYEPKLSLLQKLQRCAVLEAAEVLCQPCR